MKKLREFLRSLVEDFKAHRRGEKRIAPRGTRGRVYAPKAGAAEASDVHAAYPKARGTLTMTITRANGNVERVTAPAEVSNVRL